MRPSSREDRDRVALRYWHLHALGNALVLTLLQLFVFTQSQLIIHVLICVFVLVISGLCGTVIIKSEHAYQVKAWVILHVTTLILCVVVPLITTILTEFKNSSGLLMWLFVVVAYAVVLAHLLFVIVSVLLTPAPRVETRRPLTNVHSNDFNAGVDSEEAREEEEEVEESGGDTDNPKQEEAHYIETMVPPPAPRIPIPDPKMTPEVFDNRRRELKKAIEPVLDQLRVLDNKDTCAPEWSMEPCHLFDLNKALMHLDDKTYYYGNAIRFLMEHWATKKQKTPEVPLLYPVPCCSVDDEKQDIGTPRGEVYSGIRSVE